MQKLYELSDPLTHPLYNTVVLILLLTLRIILDNVTIFCLIHWKCLKNLKMGEVYCYIFILLYIYSFCCFFHFWYSKFSSVISFLSKEFSLTILLEKICWWTNFLILLHLRVSLFHLHLRGYFFWIKNLGLTFHFFWYFKDAFPLKMCGRRLLWSLMRKPLLFESLFSYKVTSFFAGCFQGCLFVFNSQKFHSDPSW